MRAEAIAAARLRFSSAQPRAGRGAGDRGADQGVPEGNGRKENILFAIAEASPARPSGTVREVVYPAVRGGEAALRELVHEYRTSGPAYRRTVQTTLKASYTGHYRAGLIELLRVLEFRSTNTAHQPVIKETRLVVRESTGPAPDRDTAPVNLLFSKSFSH
jgi:hypothetical protein